MKPPCTKYHTIWRHILTWILYVGVIYTKFLPGRFRPSYHQKIIQTQLAPGIRKQAVVD